MVGKNIGQHAAKTLQHHLSPSPISAIDADKKNLDKLISDVDEKIQTGLKYEWWK